MSIQEMILQVKGKVLFKLLFFGFLFANIPIYLIIGLASLGGQSVPFTVQGEKVSGVLGLLVTLLFIPIMSVMLAGTNWIYLSIGLYLYRLYKKVISKRTEEEV